MTSLTNAERDAVEAAREAPMLAQVEAWAAVNSGTRNLAGLGTMAGLLGDAFSALPGEIALVEPETVESVAPDGTISLIDHGKHLHLSVRPEAPVQMLFTGHMDTVFPVDHPFQALAWQEHAILNGPGVADMKGGIALMLAALRAIEASPVAPRFGYDVLINSDEETGSASSAALIARLAKGKVAALTYEPALPDGTLAGARAGSGNFSLIVTGRSAHAGRNPEDGRNALVAAADLALRLKRAVAPGLAVNPARIDGGGPNNVVPNHAVLRVNFRPASPADEAEARALLDRLVAAVATEHDVAIHIHGGFGRPPKPLDPAAERLFGLVKQAGADLGIPVAWKATGGVCDGNNIAACGIPVVDTMGARGGAIHSADEFLIVDSLPERAALSALTIMRIAERGDGLSFRMRAATQGDLQPLYEMAKLTGGGFTNLPADRASLIDKLKRSDAALSRDDDVIADDLFVMVLENVETGEVRGTCQLFSQVGQKWPFYSYRSGTLTQHSQELARTFRADMLTLSTDLEGSSEVGGLFLHPGERAGGLGLLIARSRYLFMREHRARFGHRVIAELRGVIDEAGGSPFWDGLAGRFFGMNFQDADGFNATHGNQFIADLMPKHPIYTAMLPESARAVVGIPHPSGRAAMRMLENEGFKFDCYIDIFDGGPTMTAETDRVRSISEAETTEIVAIAETGIKSLVSHGRLGDFRAAYARIERVPGGVAIDAEGAALLDVQPGDTITHVSRW